MALRQILQEYHYDPDAATTTFDPIKFHRNNHQSN
jgi:hypothetical protein